MDLKFELARLTVLEISNASSLKRIPDDFFAHMLQLQSLHISELMVDPLPSSLYNLKELRWLILRGCSCFKTMDSLKNFKNLTVLDASGATSLTKFIDKTFRHTPKIQMLNLSHTSINRIPKLEDLGQLTHLSLRGCKLLDRLPQTDSLTNLQALDLSGTSSLVEIEDQFFSHLSFLQILNLSKTGIKTLPSVSKLKNLRQLLLSDCIALTEIKDTYFEQMSWLQNLDNCTNLTTSTSRNSIKS
ncbi:hypothetical protein CsSME_00011434 [Camellia sinensis var. sinensis]